MLVVIGKPEVNSIAEALVDNPLDPRDLDEWVFAVKAGVRTISRLFVAETGMTFARWRTRGRIRAAVEHLAAGASVGATARAVGYRKPAKPSTVSPANTPASTAAADV